jgi:hypothetical protein
MNVLDENIPESQRSLLRNKRVAVRQVGLDVGRKGMADDELIPLLHQLDRPTFFTLDGDFYDRRLRHEGYCLVRLDVSDEQAAEYVLRVLRRRALNTKAKRMGLVIRAASAGLALWQIRHDKEGRLSWG